MGKTRVSGKDFAETYTLSLLTVFQTLHNSVQRGPQTLP